MKKQQIDVRFSGYCESPLQIITAVQHLPLGCYLHVLHRMEPLIVYKILQLEGFAWCVRHGDSTLPVELFIWRLGDSLAQCHLLEAVGEAVLNGVKIESTLDELPSVFLQDEAHSLDPIPALPRSGVAPHFFCDTLKNGAAAPTLVVLPAGHFLRAARCSGVHAHKPAMRLQHIVKPFAIGIYPVTVADFARFAQATGYKTQPEQGQHHPRKWQGWVKEVLNSWQAPGFVQNSRHPVTVINQHEAKDYCRWLCSETGYKYRLATEVEWEYACRAGSTEDWCFGNDKTQAAEYVWSQENAAGHTHPVGQKQPNAFGLYDMHGHVWEWTASFYQHKQQVIKNACIVRGGSWDNKLYLTRSAAFSFRMPLDSNARLGFRVVREINGL